LFYYSFFIKKPNQSYRREQLMSRGTINKVLIIGRLGKDPDMRYAPSGTAIASFSVATNHSVKDAEGNWNEQTEWHNIKTFGRQAEFAGEYLKKGRQVFVEGRLQTSSWEDQSGQKKYRTEIIASNVQFIGSKAEADASETPAAKEAPAPAQNDQGDVPPAEEDDLPF
jgi:single-strand DNA-binding protein